MLTNTFYVFLALTLQCGNRVAGANLGQLLYGDGFVMNCSETKDTGRTPEDVYTFRSDSSLTACQDGFVAHRNSCYLFSHETVTWADAVLTCQLFDSQLVEIEDAVENAYLKAAVKALSGSWGWYIGLTDKAVEGEFEWMDSKKSLLGIFKDWQQGNPGDNDQNCAVLYSRASYQWADTSCENKLNYICEAAQSASPSPVAPVVG